MTHQNFQILNHASNHTCFLKEYCLQMKKLTVVDNSDDFFIEPIELSLEFFHNYLALNVFT